MVCTWLLLYTLRSDTNGLFKVDLEDGVGFSESNLSYLLVSLRLGRKDIIVAIFDHDFCIYQVSLYIV